MGEHDAERGVHVEGLGLLVGARAPLGGIAHVADARAAGQVAHVAGAEDVPHETHGLVHVKLQAVERGDARGVLAAMLKQQQSVIEPLVDRFVGDESDNAAHG